MVEDGHAAAHVAGVGGVDSVVLDQRASANPGVDRAGVTEAGDEFLAGVQHLLNLVLGDLEFVRVVHFDVGGADDRNGVRRNQDIAVCRGDTAVDDGVYQAVVHGDHDAATGNHLNGVAASHVGNLAGPWAGTVEHEVGFDADGFAGLAVLGDDGRNAVAFLLQPGDLGVSQDLCAVHFCGSSCRPNELPAVNRAIFNFEDAVQVGVQAGLATQRHFGRDLLARHVCFRGASDELVGEFGVVAFQRDEETTGGFYCVGLDLAQNCIFFGAFACGDWVGDDVASAGVQKTVES